MDFKEIKYTDTIHILWAGLGLCGIRGVPSSWPVGHMWVSMEHRDEATCYGCKEKAAEKTKEKPK